MRILLGLAIVISVYANEYTEQFEKEYKTLKPYQIKQAKMIFNRAKIDGLQWTAAAIAWQESQFGRWQINMNSNNSWDCGMFQNNTKSVANHYDIPYNQYNKKEICTDLISSFKYSYLSFAKEVAFWQKVHKDDWTKIWASYNGGYKGNLEYAKMIKARINILAKHLFKD